MIPTRSASTSASSRYCVVRKTVTPSSRASRPDLLPERRPALRVEPGRRFVEEEGRRRVDQRQREVEAPLHAARVGADLAVAGRGEPDAGKQCRRSATCRCAPRIPCSEACRRRCSRPVRNGSSAVSWSAAPIAARTFGPSRTTSKPGDRGPPGRGREERRQHVHRGRLPGPVRAQKAVDLARARSRGRSRRPLGSSLNVRTRPSTSIPLLFRRHIGEPIESPDGGVRRATLEGATMIQRRPPISRTAAARVLGLVPALRTRRSRGSCRRSCSASTD